MPASQTCVSGYAKQCSQNSTVFEFCAPAPHSASELHIEPLQLFVSEDFVKKGRGNVRLRDAGARAGVKLYIIPPAETPKPHIDTAMIEAEERAAEQAEAAIVVETAAVKKKKAVLLAGVAAAVVAAIIAALGVVFLKPKPKVVP